MFGIEKEDFDTGSTIGQRSRDETIEIASKLGLVCFFPMDDELFLDLDRGSVMNTLVRDRLAENGVLMPRELLTTSHGGNRHLYLKVDYTFNATEKAALQATLGSDAVREALTILRLKEGCDEDAAIALFETPQEASRVEKWRSTTGGTA